MDVLQNSLEQAVAQLPAIFLEQLIEKKLRAQGITNPRRFSKKITNHIMTRDKGPLRIGGRKERGTIVLDFSESDTAELTKDMEHFFETRFSQLVDNLAETQSESLLKDLRSRWDEECATQQVDFSDFRNRLEAGWGQPLGKLRMLLTMAREWCQWAHDREMKGRQNKRKHLRTVLIRLLVRGLQVTDEIICLLENGFADGAMARWRTLHEITVVAIFISQRGESAAKRYFEHQAVESKRAMDKYLLCYEQLGYKPLAPRTQKRIVVAFEQVVKRYGDTFKGDYGWAALDLNGAWPRFSDLEAAVGKAEMRSYYQMGNDNIHAGIKSLYVRLGLLNNYTSFLSGRSNAGLTDPGQNTAYSLTQLAAVVCLPGNFDDMVTGHMLRKLRSEIPRSFYRADKRLRRDDREFRDSQRGTI